MSENNLKTQDLYQYHSLVDEPEKNYSRYSEILTQDHTNKSQNNSQVMIEINDFDY